MSALPPIQNLSINHDSDAINAYNVCLDFESQAANETSLIHARLLGYLILHAPSQAALHEIVKVIHSYAHDFNSLSDLGDSFINYFIRPFKKFKVRTPASSDHSSRPSFNKDKEKLKLVIQEAPKDHKEAKIQALIRDGYRCMVTKIFDRAAEEIPNIDEQEIDNFGVVYTQCAHIVPESTYFNVSGTDTNSAAKKDYAASVLAVLKCFGYDTENLNGAKVHSLYNVMTMTHDVYDRFDRLEAYFESTSVTNCYHIKTFARGFKIPNTVVTFTSPDPVALPVPSSELLALHAACAKVAHLSGAAEQIDMFDRDMDDLYVLASDGSSSALLNHAILNRMAGLVGVEG